MNFRDKIYVMQIFNFKFALEDTQLTFRLKRSLLHEETKFLLSPLKICAPNKMKKIFQFCKSENNYKSHILANLVLLFQLLIMEIRYNIQSVET